MSSFNGINMNDSDRWFMGDSGQSYGSYSIHEDIFIKKSSQKETFEIDSGNNLYKSEMDESIKCNNKSHPKKQFIIKRPIFLRELSSRTIKDHEIITKRRNACNRIYDKVKQLLQYISGKWQIGQLRDTANMIADKANIILDRLAKRYNECLICWFCENWSSIAPHLVDYATELLNINENGQNNFKFLNILTIVNNISTIDNMNEISLKTQDDASSPIEETISPNKLSFTIKTDQNSQIEGTRTKRNKRTKRTSGDSTMKQEALTEQFQNKSLTEFLFKIFDENFDCFYSFGDEFY